MKATSNKVYTPVTYKYVKPVYAHKHLPMLTDMDVPGTLLMQTLYKALRMRRASGSQTEAQFVAWLANRLPVSMIDEAGNIHVDLRRSEMDATMFTAHTDTVHREGGVNAIRIDRTDPKKILWRADEGACLGADDGAGIALMHHMISEGVAGYYIFFRGEECGGIGSKWLARHMPTLLAKFDACVSFDRADYADVVTHQWNGRCCSDKYADALAAALSTETEWFMPDITGVFTDSANMQDDIPECTNLSVGYKNQHGDGEWQDVTFLAKLADNLVKVPWNSLPIERDPLEVEYVGKNVPLSGWAKQYAPVEDDLMDALADAQQGKYHMLRGLVAAHLLPDTPEDALKYVDPSRLTTENYAHYEHELALLNMIDAEVLDELVEYLYTEK